MPNLTRLLVILPKTFTTSCIVSKLSKLRVENITVRDGTRIFQDSDITGLPWILPWISQKIDCHEFILIIMNRQPIWKTMSKCLSYENKVWVEFLCFRVWQHKQCAVENWNKQLESFRCHHCVSIVFIYITYILYYILAIGLA